MATKPQPRTSRLAAKATLVGAILFTASAGLAWLSIGAEPASVAAFRVYDPHGEVIARLTARHFPFTPVNSVAELLAPSARLDPKAGITGIVLVGRDALTDDDAKNPAWADLVASGVHLIVLEQRYPNRPLRKPAVPIETWLVEFSSPSALSDTNTPLLDGIGPDAFKKLSLPKEGDFVPLYGILREKNAPNFDPNGKERYTKRIVPPDAATTLGENTEAPIYTPLLTYPHGHGAAALCQLPIGTKLPNDPAAQRLFDNLLTWASTTAPQASATRP
jgi:hypothetical protein